LSESFDSKETIMRDYLFLAVLGSGLLVGYLLPTIVAFARKAPSIGSVVVVNVLLGWTLVGWTVAFAMAFRSHPQAAIVNVHQVVPGRPQDPNPPF
jgi:xanthosine utilization system XapX-like protein